MSGTELFRLFGTIGLNGVDDVNKDLDGVSNNASSAGSKIASGLKKAGIAATVAIGAAATAIGAIGKKSIEAYAEAEQLIGGVKTLFGDSANTVIKNARDAYYNAGLSANEYMETVTSFSASLLQSLGGDTVKAAEYADRALIDMSDNANKMGTDISMIQNAYQGFAKQNYTMLDNLKLGYGGTKEEMARLIQEASKMTKSQKELGVTVDANSMSFGNIVNAISVVQKEMGIAGATADEAKTTITGSLNMVKASWENVLIGMTHGGKTFDEAIDNLGTSIGYFADNLMPRLTKVLSGIGKLITQLAPKLIPMISELLTELLPHLVQGVKDLLRAVIDALPGILKMILEILPDLIDAIIELTKSIIEQLPMILEMLIMSLMDLLPQLIQGIVSVVLMLCNNFEKITQPIIDNLPTLILTIVQSLMDNLPLLLAGIIDLVLAIVEQTPVIMQSVVDMIPELVEMIVTALLNCLPQIIAGLIKLVWGIIKALPQIFKGFYESIVNIFVGIWEAIKNVFGNGNAKQWFEHLWVSVKDAVLGVWKDIKEKFGEIWNKIKSAFSNVGEWFKEKFNNAKENAVNAWNNIKQKFSEKWNNIKDAFSKVGNWFKDTFNDAKEKAHTAWNNVKQKFSERWENVKSAFSNVGSWFKDTFTKAKDGAVNAWGNVKQKFTDIKNKIADAFSDIKEKLSAPFKKAGEKIKEVVDAIKSWFANIKIKLPHFKIEGKFSLSPLSVPKLKIDWYAKGGVLNKPTIFGVNGMSLMGGGEAGKEAVAPINVLQSYVKDAVRSELGMLESYLMRLVDTVDEYLPKTANKNVVLDSGALVGAMCGNIDSRMGELNRVKERWG